MTGTRNSVSLPTMSHIIVFCTCPVGESSHRIAEALVQEKLAACINIIAGIQSVYTWQGATEKSDEQLLLIKTRRDKYPELEARLKALHPYELPEIVAVSLDAALPAYLKWIDDAV